MQRSVFGMQEADEFYLAFVSHRDPVQRRVPNACAQYTPMSFACACAIEASAPTAASRAAQKVSRNLFRFHTRKFCQATCRFVVRFQECLE